MVRGERFAAAPAITVPGLKHYRGWGGAPLTGAGAGQQERNIPGARWSGSEATIQPAKRRLLEGDRDLSLSEEPHPGSPRRRSIH